MSRLRQWGFIFLSLVLSLILAACESDEDRQIAEAQDCLNNASPTLASANVCLAKVDGLTSEESYYIRCSARFLGQGFVGSRFADAFESLADDEDGGGGGQDAMTTALTVMVFTGTDNANAKQNATNTLNECLLSGSQGLSRLAALTSLATTLASAVTGINLNEIAENGLTQTQVDDLIANLTNDGEFVGEDEELGNIALTANTLFCADEDSDFADTDICTNIDAAIAAGGGDPATIGDALRDQLATN